MIIIWLLAIASCATSPKSSIRSPANGSNVKSGTSTTITGTASASAGTGVAAVEVSVDGGTTWQRASGRESWSFDWTSGEVGPVTIKSRALDNRGRREAPSAGVTVTVGGKACPCSIWSTSSTPGTPASADAIPVELGVKFRSDVDGFITGLRFYKGSTNTGTHVGRLWSSAGAKLAEATFTGESASGWQEVTFDSPVAITENTTYIASYHTPSGHYAIDPGYFASTGVDNVPLHALQNGADGGNGVYVFGARGNVPPTSSIASNYWVDIVFSTSVGPDTTAPNVSSRSPVSGATGAAATAKVTVSFNEAMDATTVNGGTFELRDSANAVVASTVVYSAGTRAATLDPTAELTSSATYTATVKGGDAGVRDTSGNALAVDENWSFTIAAPLPPSPDEGPGGPILVISKAENPFTQYYAEILRTEGLNVFTVKDVSTIDAATLAQHDVAILGDMTLSAAQVAMLSTWVTAGGNLIAMRPDQQLSDLLGLTGTGLTLSDAYLQVNTASGPGRGIVGETIQFHGAADRYSLNGASIVATLYSTATTPTLNPAVTLRSIGARGGQAAAFTFDLARSVVYTRQGNPAWAGQERDGARPVRSDDLYFGGAEPDWVDLSKVAIPQSDEQQRLLVNLIGQMNFDRKPLPRFWYFPRGEKAVVIMTGDDHGGGGTPGRFDTYKAQSPPDCSVPDWECVRASSYIYLGTPGMNDAASAGYHADGFEVGLHVDTSCIDWTAESLESAYAGQLASWSARLPSIPLPSTNRTHCIAWSDWATQPKVELAHGIRLDTNYYYWPQGWVQGHPGMFTGSGMPMRFADLDGTMIDVFQAVSQMTDESGQSYPATIDALLDGAIGPQGYYGAFTANMHTDSASHGGSDAIVASALARSVPVVSGRQMLTWLDGRNGSSFDSLSWSGSTLSFTITVGAGANGLQAMVPTHSAVGTLTSITCNGSPVLTTHETIKGVEYAFFEAAAGNYAASYVDDSTPP